MTTKPVGSVSLPRKYSTPIAELLGQTIQVARVERGWSQKELAKRAGVATETAARVERGEISPKVDYAEWLLGALGYGLAIVEATEAKR